MVDVRLVIWLCIGVHFTVGCKVGALKYGIDALGAWFARVVTQA